MDKPVLNYPRILLGYRPQTLGELFSKPSRWGKGSDARTAQGNSVEVRNPDAVQWCIGGGIRLVYNGDQAKIHEVHEKFRAYMETFMGKVIDDVDPDEDQDEDAIPDVATWNDNPDRTFKELRRMLNATGI